MAAPSGPSRTAQATPSGGQHPLGSIGNYRWLICALLFLATTINYIDRQILSLIKPILDEKLGWTNEEFGIVNSAFQAAYAVGLLGFGWFIDRFGTKVGYAVSIAAWSVAAMAHGLVGSVRGFFYARIALGLGEGGNFPAAIKAVALWFPKRERALATSIFNSGTNVGAILAPAMVPWIAVNWGWHWAFILAGIAGFLWLFLWIPFYNIPEKISRLKQSERDHILSDKDDQVASALSQPSKTSKRSMLSFDGRIPRAGFIGGVLALCGLNYVIGIVFADLFRLAGDAGAVITLVVRLAWVVLGAWTLLALQARRWHDTGKSGGLSLISVVIGVAVAGAFYAMADQRPEADSTTLVTLTYWSRWLVYSLIAIGLVSLLVQGIPGSNSGSNNFGREGVPGLLGYKQTWSFIVAKFMTDPVWWFFLIWLPDYFKKTRGLDIKESWIHLVTIYTIVTVLSIFGGWVTGYLTKIGWTVTRARKTGMFFFALCVVPILFATRVGDWTAVLLIGLAGAAHQAWSANLFTTVSDMFPKRAVASVIGIGGMAGAIGGMLFPIYSGRLLDYYKGTEGGETAGYAILFAICAFAYLVTWGVHFVLAPRLEQIDLKEETA